MLRYILIWLVCAAAIIYASFTFGYRVGRHYEAEAHAHITNAPVIGLDGAGHIVSSLHWTDASNEYFKNWFTSGEYTLNVWKKRYCAEDE